MFLVGYIVFRVGGFIFRLFLSGLGNSQRQGNFNSRTYKDQPKKRAPGSNLNIDHVPNDQRGRGKKYDGGEYVDYEDVK